MNKLTNKIIKNLMERVRKIKDSYLIKNNYGKRNKGKIPRLGKG
jgi:hypothetical protein